MYKSTTANRQLRRTGRSKIMKVLVLGGDGYLGWPTALHLSEVGHEVAVADNFARRGYDHEMGVDSLVPIESLQVRVAVGRALTGKPIGCYVGNPADAHLTHAPSRALPPPPPTPPPAHRPPPSH